MEVTGAYGNDLAEIHHHHFGDVARQAAPVVLRALSKIGARGLVVDPAAGAGSSHAC